MALFYIKLALFTLQCSLVSNSHVTESHIHVYYLKPKVSRKIKISGLMLAARTVLTNDNRTALVAFTKDSEVGTNNIT